MDIAAVLIRASTKAQEKDNEIQDDGFSLDLDESFFQQSKTRNKKSKKQKRVDALRAVQRSGTELPPPYGKEQLVKEQNEDETIQPIWRDLRQNDSTIYVVEEDICTRNGLTKLVRKSLEWLSLALKEDNCSSCHILLSRCPSWKKLNSGKITQKFLLARHDS